MTERRHMEIRVDDGATREAYLAICDDVRQAGGHAYLVGGCVRDTALGIPTKNIDIEVYGVSPDRLVDLLSARFNVDLVGQSFGVIKVQHLPVDVSIPRRESKAGLGHRGFEILSDPDMTLEEAAARRDFTMNALALDPFSGEVVDYYGGLADIEGRVLRHTTERFAEDPLRVLRGMQFAARFDLVAAPETIELCRTIEPEGLAPERIFEEWRKLILQGVVPSRGLSFLRESGWIRYFPELAALVGCEQDPEWHPEGDAWTHTLHAMDAFADERTGDEWEDLVVGLAVLCHDLGKPETSEEIDGRIRSFGHEPVGGERTRTFLSRMTRQGDVIDQVVPLVEHHMKPRDLYEGRAGSAAIRRLAQRVGRIDRLVRVARADQVGCPPRPYDDFPAGKWLIERARVLAVADSVPRPIVQGRDLIEIGLAPGPHFGGILRACYDAQIEGEFATLEEGIEYAREIIAKTEGEE